MKSIPIDQSPTSCISCRGDKFEKEKDQGNKIEFKDFLTFVSILKDKLSEKKIFPLIDQFATSCPQVTRKGERNIFLWWR